MSPFTLSHVHRLRAYMPRSRAHEFIFGLYGKYALRNGALARERVDATLIYAKSSIQIQLD
jgi:hypothetical protein